MISAWKHTFHSSSCNFWIRLNGVMSGNLTNRRDIYLGSHVPVLVGLEFMVNNYLNRVQIELKSVIDDVPDTNFFANILKHYARHCPCDHLDRLTRVPRWMSQIRMLIVRRACCNINQVEGHGNRNDPHPQSLV